MEKKGTGYRPIAPDDGTYVPYVEIKKTDCDDTEVKVYGFCHKIQSRANLTCPDGYISEEGKCYKEIKKTCNKTCTYEAWSNWSNWSTTKVVANDTTEVETKTE